MLKGSTNDWCEKAPISQLGQFEPQETMGLGFVVVQSLRRVWLFVIPGTLQHACLPSPSLSPEFCSHSCPLNWWCYLTISTPAASSPFAFNLPQHQVFFPQCISSSHYVERVKAGGEGDNRGWDSWMASLTLWTWVWASSGSWWWTGKPDVL